jgi:hypothetical protein
MNAVRAGDWIRASQLPLAFRQACRRWGVLPSRFLLVVNIGRQRMHWLERAPAAEELHWRVRRVFRISTSRFGIGQKMHSNCTPLGLHRVARKVGGGYPLGAVFKSRVMLGYTWQGRARASITHRILWLEGLEPGFNRGGEVDTFARYIYIHGTGDEPTLGRPASHGCIHLAAADLLPLYDVLPRSTLVWIQR